MLTICIEYEPIGYVSVFISPMPMLQAAYGNSLFISTLNSFVPNIMAFSLFLLFIFYFYHHIFAFAPPTQRRINVFTFFLSVLFYLNYDGAYHFINNELFLKQIIFCFSECSRILCARINVSNELIFN